MKNLTCEKINNDLKDGKTVDSIEVSAMTESGHNVGWSMQDGCSFEDIKEDALAALKDGFNDGFSVDEYDYINYSYDNQDVCITFYKDQDIYKISVEGDDGFMYDEKEYELD